MSILSNLSSLHGSWSGVNRLWASSAEPVRESTIALSLEPAAQERAILLRYEWSYEDRPQEGILLLGDRPSTNRIKAVWIDSWHVPEDFMILTGSVGAGDDVTLIGSYAAPPEPDWGWQIDFRLESDDRLRLLMYNIPPRQEAELAVEARLQRA